VKTGKKFNLAITAIQKHPRKKYMNVKALAKQIGVSVHTVYDARKYLNEDVFGVVGGGATIEMISGNAVDALTKWASPDTDIQKLVVEKNKTYGHPLDNFRRANAALVVIDECKDVEVRHALTMLWLKITRLVETPDHFDSIEDLKGYAETIHMIHAERKKRC